jgi:hypothetical protein
MYPTEFLLKKAEEGYKGESAGNIYEISRQLSLPDFIKFYFKNKNDNYFPPKLLFKNIALKVSK